MWIIYVLIALVLVTAFSGGLALGLHLFLPRWSQRKRIIWAAALATLLPMTIPFGGFFYEAGSLFADGGEEFVLGLLAMIVLTLVIAAVICLPTAWFVSSRLDRGKDDLALEGPDEPDLLPSGE